MPGCYRCGTLYQASADVRRTTRGHVCKDRLLCMRRDRRRQQTIAEAVARLALARLWQASTHRHGLEQAA